MRSALYLAALLLIGACSTTQRGVQAAAGPAPAAAKQPAVRLAGAQLYGQDSSYLEQRIRELEYRICQLEQRLAGVYYEVLDTNGVITRGNYDNYLAQLQC